MKGVNVVDGISDHDIVEINLNFIPKTKRRKRRKVFLRDKANEEAIFKDLDDFSNVYNSDFANKSVDEKWTAISDAINKTIEANVPQKLTSARHDVPWFSNELRRLMKTKRRRYNRYRTTGDVRDWEKYRKTRNEVSSKLRSAKAKYYGDELGEAIENNSKAFWTHLKKLRKEDVGVADLKDEAGKLVTDSKSKAEMLNKQFVSVFTNESGQPPSMESEPVEDCPPLIISEEGVEKLLRDLNPSKACGADNIPAWFLKMASKQLAPIFTNLFQSSIDSGVVPEEWRRANITALFKKGDRSDPGNYRPVSLTSVTCKVLEHIVHSHVMKHLESHSILVDTQHGFRAKRSTESQLILTINDIAKTFDAKKNVDMAVLDFTKAFDKVPHRRLIHKLRHYGIRNSLSNWIKNFLSNRVQSVVVEGESSTSAAVLSGVPQGTVLGPLLFLIYINDLPDELQSKCRLFADDCLVYKEITSSADIDILKEDMQQLEIWQDKWLMQFNPKKCSTVTFGTRNPPKHEYSFCNELLKSEDSTTYLGVEFNNTLSWNNQTQAATKKAQKVLGMIRRNLWSCPEKVKVTAYTSLVRPHLEYAAGAWCPYRKRNIKSLERIQRQAARFCKADYSREPGTVTKLLSDLKWETLETRRLIHRLSMMYKIRHELVEIPMSQHFVQNTRSSRPHNQKYIRPATRIDAYKYSFFPASIKEWNKLPAHVVECATLEGFKASLHSHFGGNQLRTSN